MDGREEQRQDGILRLRLAERAGAVDGAPSTVDLSPLHLGTDGAPFLAPGQDDLALDAMRSAGVDVPAGASLTVADGHEFCLDDGGKLVAEVSVTIERPAPRPHRPRAPRGSRAGTA